MFVYSQVNVIWLLSIGFNAFLVFRFFGHTFDTGISKQISALNSAVKYSSNGMYHDVLYTTIIVITIL